jgi:DNA-binding transcriptional LysR family regulator
MELRQLRYFVAVARHLHFGAAAAELQMAQPPLSQQIRKLEDELGVELFTRTSRKVALTEHGEQLLVAARRVLHEADAVRELADGLRDGNAGRLRIAFVASVLNWGLAPILRGFRSQNPGVLVTATQMPVADQVEALAEHRIDIGFTLGKLDYDFLDVQVLSVEPLVVLLPSDDPNARDDMVDLRRLSDQTFLIWRAPFGPHLDDFITRACGEAGFYPKLMEVGPQIQTIAHMVAAGYGVGMMPSCDRVMTTPGAVFRNLVPPAPSTVLSAVRHRRSRNPVVPRLLAELPHIDM